jgi:hypothetical protein
VVASSAVPLPRDSALPLRLGLALFDAELREQTRQGESLLSELGEQAVGLLLARAAGRGERTVGDVLLDPLNEVQLAAHLVEELEPDDISSVEVERLLDSLTE